MVLDQLVRGLQDSEIQRKVLSRKEVDFNLDAVEKVAEESSKASQKESKATEESCYVSCHLIRRAKNSSSKNQPRAARTVDPVPTTITGNYLKAGRKSARLTRSFVQTVESQITLKKFARKLKKVWTKKKTKVSSIIP